MDASTEQLDFFISRLYRSAHSIALEHFRHWALKELQELVEFDSALWSTGHLSTRRFHTHTIIGLKQDYPDALLGFLPKNPISGKLFNNPGKPVDMADVVSDEDFYQSEIYRKLFRPNGIERILSSMHIDSRSGIYTLLTLYRAERDHVFDEDEKRLYRRALIHLLNASSQACIAQLRTPVESKVEHYAIVDRHGVYHEAEPGFLDLIDEEFSNYSTQILPFDIPAPGVKQLLNGLCVSASQLGDLYRIALRQSTPLDHLTVREREVVDGVTKGLSFKQIGRLLSLSPSTVSNHLYRVYQKLNISNRSELAEMIQEH